MGVAPFQRRRSTFAGKRLGVGFRGAPVAARPPQDYGGEGWTFRRRATSRRGRGQDQYGRLSRTSPPTVARLEAAFQQARPERLENPPGPAGELESRKWHPGRQWSPEPPV